MIAYHLWDQCLRPHVPRWKSSTHSVKERLAPLPVCQYKSKMKVAGVCWQVWKDSGITARGHYCLQGGHNGRGDPCETLHLWKRWRGQYTLFFCVQLIPRIRSGDSALCLCIHKSTTSAAMHLCAAAYRFSFCLSTMPWCLFVCEFTPAFIFLLGTVRTKWTTYHTKAKSWQRLFHIAKRLHNMILSVLCTHPHAHTKLGCRWREAPHVHTPYSHCLFPAYSNTLWACADRRCTHMHTLSGDTNPLQL